MPRGDATRQIRPTTVAAQQIVAGRRTCRRATKGDFLSTATKSRRSKCRRRQLVVVDVDASVNEPLVSSHAHGTAQPP